MLNSASVALSSHDVYRATIRNWKFKIAEVLQTPMA